MYQWGAADDRGNFAKDCKSSGINEDSVQCPFGADATALLHAAANRCNARTLECNGCYSFYPESGETNCNTRSRPDACKANVYSEWRPQDHPEHSQIPNLNYVANSILDRDYHVSTGEEWDGHRFDRYSLCHSRRNPVEYIVWRDQGHHFTDVHPFQWCLYLKFFQETVGDEFVQAKSCRRLVKKYKPSKHEDDEDHDEDE